MLSQEQITRFGAQLQTPDKCGELSESGQKFVADHPYIGAQYMRTRKGAPDRELAQLRTQLDTSACDRCVPRTNSRPFAHCGLRAVSLRAQDFWLISVCSNYRQRRCVMLLRYDMNSGESWYD